MQRAFARFSHIGGYACLPKGIVTALANLVRAINCYHSNLVEGHNTHPIDIERAPKKDYSADAEQRNLQLEAEAHITVQQWIDEGALRGRATSVDSILGNPPTLKSTDAFAKCCARSCCS
ncbi:MAG TPA: hypothetical protein VFY27_11835 [Woeseiaceae bacterium]|nr:hypothetical protein [Woeseiaceae bacterium]